MIALCFSIACYMTWINRLWGKIVYDKTCDIPSCEYFKIIIFTVNIFWLYMNLIVVLCLTKRLFLKYSAILAVNKTDAKTLDLGND